MLRKIAFVFVCSLLLAKKGSSQFVVEAPTLEALTAKILVMQELGQKTLIGINTQARVISTNTGDIRRTSSAIGTNTGDIKNSSNAIKKATQDSYQLMKAYHESLQAVNPNITNSIHLKEVLEEHKQIKVVYDDIVVKRPFDLYLDAQQKELFYRTLKNYQIKSLNAVQKVELILKPEALTMNDSERLMHISLIKNDLERYHNNMMAFIEVYNKYAYGKKNKLIN